MRVRENAEKCKQISNIVIYCMLHVQMLLQVDSQTDLSITACLGFSAA